MQPTISVSRTTRFWAGTVTEVFAPAVLLSALLLIVSVHTAGFAHGIGPGLLAVFFVTGLPLVAVILLVRAGKVTDHHIGNRRQRAPILAGSLGSIGLGVWILHMTDAPVDLIRAVLTSVAGIVAVLVVNLFWKLSAHSAVAVFFSMIVLFLIGAPGVAALGIPVAVGWSRVVLGAHTPAQVVAGWSVGGGIALLYVALVA